MALPKNVKYIPLDVDALDDPKIMELVASLGMEGYGIYLMLIQALARQEPDYMLPVNQIKHLAYRNRTTEDKVKAVVTAYQLFEFENDCFFSRSLIRRMEKYDRVREINAKKGKLRWKEFKKLPQNTAAVEPRLSNGLTSTVQYRTVQNSTEQNSTEQKKKEKTESEDSDPSSVLIDNSFNSEEKNNTVTDPVIIEPGEAEKLFNQVIENFTEDLRPKTLKQKADWIDTIDKLVRIDKFTSEQITEVIKFAREDSFWQTNFLSILKLRKKNKEGIIYFNVFRHAMNGARKSGSGSRNIKRVNASWASDPAPAIEKAKKEDPFARFNKDILKLFDYLKFGKLPGIKDPVFPDESIPDSEEKILSWLRCIDELMTEGHSISAIQNVIIYARKSEFWQKHLLDLLQLKEVVKYNKTLFDLIADEIYNKKHGIAIIQAEHDSISTELNKRLNNQ